MKKLKVLRHGEILLVPVNKLPKGLKQADTDILMKGSGDNPHIVENCEIYFIKENDYVFGYLKAKKNAKLLHKRHGIKKVGNIMEAPLKEGYYQLRRQVEATNEELKPVID